MAPTCRTNGHSTFEFAVFSLQRDPGKMTKTGEEINPTLVFPTPSQPRRTRFPTPHQANRTTNKKMEIKQGNGQKPQSPHHTKPRGQDPGHQMQQHPLWNANCGHQTLCFPLRTHQNEAKSNKDITKSCSPHTKQSKQDKIQATQC